MVRLRASAPAQLLGRDVEATDLAEGRPPVDAVRLLGDGVRVIVRPSGTEPKLKAYLETVVPVHDDAGLIAARGRGEDELDQLRREMSAALGL
jgi:phosphomannomutase